LQIHGEITYNGTTFAGFLPQRTAAYVEQTDLHLPELTVRETMNFAARVQGVGRKAGTVPYLHPPPPPPPHRSLYRFRWGYQ